MRKISATVLSILICCLSTNITFANICTDVEKETSLVLNDAECYVLDQVQKGEIAHFSKSQEYPFGGYLNKFSKPEDRRIRADFLQMLLTGAIPSLEVTVKSVRIGKAYVTEALNLNNATIPFDISLFEIIFEKKVNFFRAKFLKRTYFNNVRFLGNALFGEAQFMKVVTFNSAQFSANAGFGKAQFSADCEFNFTRFSNLTVFNGTRFLHNAEFKRAEFLDAALIGNAQFLEVADFSGVKFSIYANFWGTEFSGKAGFSDAEFSGEADFREAKFSGDAVFRGCQFGAMVRFFDSTFTNTLDFSFCRFKDEAHFGRAIFPPNRNANISFSMVTGFSNMLIEWEYNPEKYREEKDEKKAKRRGLKGHLKYNETLYIALIKNYRDMGWFREADDCYYTYRVEKRKHRLNKLDEPKISDESNPYVFNQWWNMAKLYGEYLLLDWTFGYGVKPTKIFRTFLLFWIPFSFYYLGFVRSNYGQKLSWWKAWNPIFKPSRLLWALIYSLDRITPGVNFESLKSLKQKVIINSDSKRILYARRLQQIFGWYWAALFLILFSQVWIR